jgi:biopolymer transport protein ExbD
MRLPKQEIRRARIEIIPMIDTIFFLLVFFMFETLTMVKMRAIEIAVPKPAPTSQTTPPPRCLVRVDASGRYFVENKPVTKDSITAAVQAVSDEAPNTLFVIDVAPTQTVQPLVDCLDGVGLAHKPGGGPVDTLIGG